MLPPPPTTTLSFNPDFAKLYNHLTEHILGPDGSTLSKTEEYEAVVKDLTAARQSAARDEILLRGLEEVALRDNDDELESRVRQSATGTNAANLRSETKRQHAVLSLPPELRELIYNVTSYLATSLDPSSFSTLPTDMNELMADELARFREHHPEISKALSAHLAATESTLASMASSLQPQSQSQSKTPP